MSKSKKEWCIKMCYNSIIRIIMGNCFLQKLGIVLTPDSVGLKNSIRMIFLTSNLVEFK